MAYGCLTTKHHDGFCLWPTATGSANVQDATYKRDVVRAYVDSFRAQGLKTCLYFSILDLRADIRPYCMTREKIDKVKAQLTELLTNYGEITALVIDGWNAAWSRLNYEEMPFPEIYRHVKQLQPNCLMSDYNQGRYPAPALYYTDVKQYEQHAGQTIPAGSEVPSQSATTLQSDWFWKLDYPTQELRSARQIVEEWLIPFNARHCNLILNVAPNRDGRFDRNAMDRLTEIGGALAGSGACAMARNRDRRSLHRTLLRCGLRMQAALPIRRGQTWQTMISPERTGSAMRGKRRVGLRLTCGSRLCLTRLRSLSRLISAITGRRAALFRIGSKRGAEDSGERCLPASHRGRWCTG